MITSYIQPVFSDWHLVGGISTHASWIRAVQKSLSIDGVYAEKVPVLASVMRDGAPSTKFLIKLEDPNTGKLIAMYATNSPAEQWFTRDVIYREVFAQALDFKEPRMGVTRWPTVSAIANHLRFSIDEGGGGGEQVPTVAAQVPLSARVDRVPAVREVAFIERMADGQWRFAGSSFSEVGDLKAAEISVTQEGDIYAVGLDDFGEPFYAGASIEVGDSIRPSNFQGWLYRCTEAGQLPSEEPAWWLEQGENPPRLVGTARLQAIRYYQPMAHGPIHYELI